MLSCCLKCRKNTESKNSKVVTIRNKNNSFIKICSVLFFKEQFIKEQEASGLLSSSGIKTLLSIISLVGPLLL